ncbi:MAG: hypothetical protein JWQ14_966, partial [Adhaeribacter sp.]|nr:hypothetical protein [Adhaeribacter sp.]
MRKRVTGCLVYIFGFLTVLVGYAQPTRPLAPTSVLSTGQWIKLGITDSGIYKIDRKWLQAAGLAPDAIDPRQLKLYGNGGGMLPQLNSAPRPDDLIQNAILVAGEADGKFDPNDYLLFYGQGPHRWSYEPGSQRSSHAFNIYADTAYYFLTISNSQGRRVPEQAEVTGANVVIDTYLQRQFHEQDLISPLQSGREWYGEEFNLFTTARNFTFPLVDLVPGSTIQVSSAVMASSKNTSAFTLKANNIQIG